MGYTQDPDEGSARLGLYIWKLQSQPMQNIQLENNVNTAAYPFDFFMACI